MSQRPSKIAEERHWWFIKRYFTVSHHQLAMKFCQAAFMSGTTVWVERMKLQESNSRPMGNPVQLPIITLFMFSMPFETPSSESQWEKMKKMDEAKTNLLWMDSCWLYLEFLEVRSYLGKFSLPKPPCWASRSLVLQNQVGPPTLQGFDGGDSCEKSHDKVEQEENENLRQQKVTSRRLFFVFQQSCILGRYFLAKSKKAQSYWP